MKALTELELFCPTCSWYLGACQKNCPECGFELSPSNCLPTAGDACWRAPLPGTLIGNPSLVKGRWLAAWNSDEPSGGGLVWLNPANGMPDGTIYTADRPLCGMQVVDGEVAVLVLDPMGGAGNAMVLGVDLSVQQPRWTHSLPGLVKCAPLLRGQQVVSVACSDGCWYSFDAFNGRVQSVERFSDTSLFNPPQVVSTWRGGFVTILPGFNPLLTYTQAGINMILAHFSERVNAMTTAPNGELMVACEDGRLYTVQLRQPPRLVVDLHKPFLAAPLSAGEWVYCGVHDNLLYRLRLADGYSGWETPFQCDGSLTVTPILAGEWLFFGDSHGWIYCLEAASGHEVWRTRTGESRVRSLTLQEGRLVAGVRYGGHSWLVCLPWHMGQYAEIAQRLEASQAGSFWAAAADHALPENMLALRERAAACWRQDGSAKALEKCAYQWLGVGENERAVRICEEIANAYRMRDPNKSARWLVTAINLWSDLTWAGSQESRVTAQRECQRLQEILRNLPHVKIPLVAPRLVNAPTFIERAEGELLIELFNLGKLEARNLRFVVGGGLEKTVIISGLEGKPLEPLLPRQKRLYTFNVRPTNNEPLHFEIQFNAGDTQADNEVVLNVPIEIKEALLLQARDIGGLKIDGVQHVVIQTAGDVGLVKVVDSTNTDVKARDIGGVMAEKIDHVETKTIVSARSRGKATVNKQKCPSCGFENEPDAKRCNDCNKEFA